MSFGEFQWVELLYVFLGSFVGFLLALLTDNYIKKREEKSKIKTLLDAIQSECQNIYELIKRKRFYDDNGVLNIGVIDFLLDDACI